MAKIRNCAFCNTELTTGFFNGNAETIEIGQTIICCENCKRIMTKEIGSSKNRLETKINNFKKASKVKLSGESVATLIMKYLEEEQQFKEKNGAQTIDKFQSFYTFNNNGYFSVHEFKGIESMLDSGNTESIASDKLLSQLCDTAPFTKDDITKIEYRFTSWHGERVNLFTEVHSIEIRLNDEKQFTYKPCITRLGVVGKGLLPNLAKRNAEKQIIEILKEFKETIGSDLPIVKVKKFI